MVTSLLAAGEAVAYYLMQRVASFLNMSDNRRANLPLLGFCITLYDWKDRPLSATAVRQEYLKGKIEEIFDDNDEAYGSMALL